MLENLKRIWFRALYYLLSAYAFHRITVTGARPGRGGPTLYLCLHRNGAIDGAVYQRVAPRARMTLSSQLRRKTWMRMIFDGIEIVRPQDAAKDGARVNNADAFAEASHHLAQGGELLFFPEGSSDLGPRHLKFRTGVAKLIQQTLAQTASLRIVPLAAHYEDPTAWQSNVDIRIGDTLYLQGEHDVAAIMAVITAALEKIGLDCDTPDERRIVETLAYAATIGNKDIPYSRALKALDPQQESAHDFTARLTDLCATAGPLRHQGVPLLPLAHSGRYYAALTLLLPLQLVLGALNALPYLATERLVHALSDAPNVRSLWRALIGVGLLALWGGMLMPALLMRFHPALIPLYWLACILQIKTLYRTKKLAVTVVNHAASHTTLRNGSTRALLDLHQALSNHVRAKL